MSEQYRFMRYYLPGSLLLFYSALLMIVSLSVNDVIRILDRDGIIAIFLGFLGASPVIGYLIYAPYNLWYEIISENSRRRRSLAIVDKWAEDKGYRFRNHHQRKEFLDLVNNASSSNHEPTIGSEVLDTMRNHLSNYSARVICGFLVPIFAFKVYAIFIGLLLSNVIPSLSLSINCRLLGLFSVIVCVASFLLLWPCSRVLDEFFELEEFLILSREANAMDLLDSIAPGLIPILDRSLGLIKKGIFLLAKSPLSGGLTLIHPGVETSPITQSPLFLRTTSTSD